MVKYVCTATEHYKLQYPQVFPVPVEAELTENQSPLILYGLNRTSSHTILLGKSLCYDFRTLKGIHRNSLPFRISCGAILPDTVRVKRYTWARKECKSFIFIGSFGIENQADFA
jgi:hypothetical protein